MYSTVQYIVQIIISHEKSLPTWKMEQWPIRVIQSTEFLVKFVFTTNTNNNLPYTLRLRQNAATCPATQQFTGTKGNIKFLLEVQSLAKNVPIDLAIILQKLLYIWKIYTKFIVRQYVKNVWLNC
jgi:hypothetical protein